MSVVLSLKTSPPSLAPFMFLHFSPVLDKYTFLIDRSCVTVATNLTDGAGQGRCDSDPLTPGTVWAHGYCPTDYSWMGLLGLVMYLMFFAPGTTYLLSIPTCNFSFQSFLQRAEFTSCACHAPIYPYFLLHLCCSFIRLTESI